MPGPLVEEASRQPATEYAGSRAHCEAAAVDVEEDRPMRKMPEVRGKAGLFDHWIITVRYSLKNPDTSNTSDTADTV
jgi:hypothetical protein